ncbi:MAG: multidrug effflux MFS transporter [Pseudomonadota bacterium]
MKQVLLILTLIITLIAANIELDIYVPALPQMLHYFATTSGRLQWIISINFISIAISSLFYGPLSDHYGRKKIMLVGLIIFVISSLGCVLAHSLATLIFWRFFQGIGSSAPVVAGFAAMAEIYTGKKAAQLISIGNSVITGSMAAAPIIGNFLTIYFDWRANFTFIFILAVLALIMVQLFFQDTHVGKPNDRLNFKSISRAYVDLIKNKRFLVLGTIPCLLYAGMIVYISNLSLLFVNYLGVTQADVGYYQAVIMFTFLIFSFITVFLLHRFTTQTAQTLGLFVVFIASLLLLVLDWFWANDAKVITIIMSIYQAGSAIALGPFMSEALNTHPQRRGTASALLGGLRLTFASIVVAIAGYLFDGSLTPIAMIIFILMAVNMLLYGGLRRSE